MQRRCRGIAKLPTRALPTPSSSSATCTIEGEGVPQDYAAASSWYRKAADQGNPDAQFILGGTYYAGRGVPKDYAAAAEWFRKAADQGNVKAQFLLGQMYDRGEGVPQDYAAAVSWYRKAADQGLAQAQFLLGSRYLQGQGVPQDYTQAHMWLNIAAANLQEKEYRDKAIENRDGVAARMTPAQIAEAQRRAREWKPKSER